MWGLCYGNSVPSTPAVPSKFLGIILKIELAERL